MRAKTALSHCTDPQEAVGDVYKQLVDEFGSAPSWVVMSHGEDLPGEELSAAWAKLAPKSSLHRLTTCHGSMGDFGFEGACVLSAFALLDEPGAYTSAMGPVGKDIAADVQAVLDQLQDASERPGEAPDLLFVTATPGIEEAVLVAIQKEFGEHVLVVGGSAADDEIAGKWSLGNETGSLDCGIVVSALYTSKRVSASFGSSYLPTGKTGVVTAAHNRQILTIDGKPASDVYNGWSGGAIDEVLTDGGGTVLTASSLSPIGRKLALKEGGSMYMLSHPASAVSKGPLDMFSGFESGDQIELMSGSVDSLVQRAGRVVERSLDVEFADGVAGSLVVYCAGCRLAVAERMAEIPPRISASLWAPFLGVFTFGEQGPTDGSLSRHGNLMISVVTFFE